MMRHLLDAIGTILTVALAASNNPSVDQIKMRLEMSYEATEEARGMVANEEYLKASQSYADALNLGRKSALSLQELEDDEELQSDRQQALQWLVDIFCESCLLNVNHLDNLATARADAWAACMFSKYQLRHPLECMKTVCERDGDNLGELQMCQHLLKLEDDDKVDRKKMSKRLEELEQILSQN